MTLVTRRRVQLHNVVYPEGAAVVVPDDEARALLREAPDCYAVAEAPTPPLAAPHDKMQRRGKVKDGIHTQ